MNVAVLIAIVAVLALVVYIVGAPLRAQRGRRGTPARADARAEEEAGELEAAREAKYREIRDAELDFRTGKLTAEDHAAIDAQLRHEALELLDRIERARGGAGEDAGSGPGGATRGA